MTYENWTEWRRQYFIKNNSIAMNIPTHTDKDRALELTDQLIEKAKEEDERHKSECLSNGKAEQAVGESFMIHHLKVLKDLINKL